MAEPDPANWHIGVKGACEWKIYPYDQVRHKIMKEIAFVQETADAIAYIEYARVKEPALEWVLLEDLEVIPVPGGFRNPGEGA